MPLTASTLSVNLTTGKITKSDPISIREDCAVTLTGTGDRVNSNIRLYIKNVDGDELANCGSFSGGQDAFTGTLDLNTEELIAEFTGLSNYADKEFTLQIYDVTDNSYLVNKTVVIQNKPLQGDDDATAVTPIDDDTTTFGDLKLYNGKLYKYNQTDGLWYPWTAAGAGDQMHGEFDTDGGLDLS